MAKDLLQCTLTPLDLRISLSLGHQPSLMHHHNSKGREDYRGIQEGPPHLFEETLLGFSQVISVSGSGQSIRKAKNIPFGSWDVHERPPTPDLAQIHMLSIGAGLMFQHGISIRGENSSCPVSLRRQEKSSVSWSLLYDGS